MTLNKIFKPNIKHSSMEIAVFLVLIFISFNLIIASFWSMCREQYAIDPANLKRVRSILVIATILQLICFTGYWLGIYIMYELCWIFWLTLSTFSVLLLGIRFGESYIILVTQNYSLKDHNKIPSKYKYLSFIFWLVGCCVDATGTVFGLTGNQSAQSYCYSIWEVLCSISIGFLIYILNSVRNKFKDLHKQKLNYKQEKKQQDKKRRKVKPILEEHSDNPVDDINETLDIQSIKSLRTAAPGEKSCSTSYIYTGSLDTQSVTVTSGSINDGYSLLSNCSHKINSEINRMRNLIIGLCFLIVVFLLNAVFNGFFRFTNSYQIYSNPPKIYMDTPVWVVAVIFFPQWTVINVFIMVFSWIPRYQLEDDYES